MASPEDILANFKKIFMTNEGTIDDESKLADFVKAIRETDKRSDLRYFYSQILKKSTQRIRESFVSEEIGGWKIICKWYGEAIDSGDDDLLTDVLDLISKVPFRSAHLLNKNGKPRPIRRYMKKSAKHKNPDVSRLAKSICKQIQKLIGDERKDNKNDVALQLRSILMSADRRSRSRKSLRWRPDERISEVRYFEYIEDERCNVSRPNAEAAAATAANAVAASPNSSPNKSHSGLNTATPGGSSGDITMMGVSDPRTELSKRSEVNSSLAKWRPLVPIDMACQNPTPGWNSKERIVEAERESRVLGAIDLPGQQSTLDEPDHQPRVEGLFETRIIPLEAIGSETKIQDYSHLSWDSIQMQASQPTLPIAQPVLQPFQQQRPTSVLSPAVSFINLIGYDSYSLQPNPFNYNRMNCCLYGNNDKR